MRLGVNIVRLTRPFTGVGRFVECVLDEWSRMEWPFTEIVLFAPKPVAAERVVFSFDRFRLEVGGPRGPDPWWETIVLNRAARKLDVLWCPSYTTPIGYPGRHAVVYHGPSDNPRFGAEWRRALAYDRLHRFAARRADRVFVVSERVKRHVTEVFGVPEERVDVAYVAAGGHFRPIVDAEALAAARRRYAGADAPFTLFVGKLSHRHAIPNLIAAFARAVRGGSGRRLVLAGPDVVGLDAPALARVAGIGDAVVHHPFVEHRRLAELYSAAEVVVFPATDAEGFGVPLVEAMACGAPVVSTALGSVPEVVADAALLVADNSVPAWEAALRRVHADPALRADLAAKGLRRAPTFTWRRTAGILMDRLAELGRTARP